MKRKQKQNQNSSYCMADNIGRNYIAQFHEKIRGFFLGTLVSREKCLKSAISQLSRLEM